MLNKKVWILCLLASGLSGGVALGEESEFVYDAKGKRDPFSSPGAAHQTATASEVLGRVTQLRALEVQGIIWDEKNPMAILNDEILTRGSVFQGATVVEIFPHEVVLELQGEKITLAVKEEEETPAAAKPNKEILKKKDKERGASK